MPSGANRVMTQRGQQHDNCTLVGGVGNIARRFHVIERQVTAVKALTSHPERQMCDFFTCRDDERCSEPNHNIIPLLTKVFLCPL
jgi:hypothetical protein